MRTSSLRVTVGAYSDGSWHVAQIHDHYERGVLVNSTIESLRHPDSFDGVRTMVLEELAQIYELELARRGAEGVTEARPAVVTLSAPEPQTIYAVPD